MWARHSQEHVPGREMGREVLQQGAEGIRLRGGVGIGPATWTMAGAGREVAAWLEPLGMEMVREDGRSEGERKWLQVGAW